MNPRVRVVVAILAMLACSLAEAQCGPGGCRIPGYGSGGWRSAPRYEQPRRPTMPAPSSQAPTVPDPVRESYESLVKISAEPWGGSGTYIGGRVVVSCEHVFNGVRGAVLCVFPSGEQIRVDQIRKDASQEFAVLLLEEEPDAPGIPLAERPVRVGDRIWMAGYGSDRKLSLTGGRVQNTSLGMRAYDPTRRREKFMPAAQAQGTTYSGDSGGAWLTDDGELVAVHWGGSAGSCYGTSEGLREYVEKACQGWRIRFPCKRRPREEPEEEPEVPPAPIVQPPPKVDLGPLERSIDSLGDRLGSRLDGVDRKLDATVSEVRKNREAIVDLDLRVGVLEKPPDRHGLLFWTVIGLAAISAVIVGGIIYFANE